MMVFRRGRCCVADQHHLHASYQVCAEADFFKTERIDPQSKDERILFKVRLHTEPLCDMLIMPALVLAGC